MTSTTARSCATAAYFAAVSALMERCFEAFRHGDARAPGELFQPGALVALADGAHVKQIDVATHLPTATARPSRASGGELDGRWRIASKVFQVDTEEARPCPT